MRARQRLTVIVAVMAATILLPTSLVSAQSYDSPDGAVTINDTTLTSGQSFTVTASGFRPGSPVEVIFNSTPILLGTPIASATGTATGSYAVPASAEAGSHTIQMKGIDPSGGALSRSVAVTVMTTAQSGSTTADTPRRLAFTGASSAAVALCGVVLLGSGAMLLQFRRRRLGATD